MSIADMGSAAAESSGSSSSGSVDPDEYERYDVSNATFIKMHPGPTAIGGTAVATRYLPGDPDGAGLDRGDVGLVVEDPFIPDDESLSDVALFEGDGETDDFKVVNLSDESTEALDGTGVMFEKNTYIGEEVTADALPDEVVIKLTGNAGRSAAACLDVDALGAADVERTSDGAVDIKDYGFPEHNGKLIEYIDDEGDDYTPPRYAAEPELRPDVEGTEVTVMLQRLEQIDDEYEGPAYWSTVFAAVDDDRRTELAEQYAESDSDERDSPEAFTGTVNGQDVIELAPTDEFERSDLTMAATGFLETTDNGGSWPTEEELEELRAEQGIEVEAES